MIFIDNKVLVHKEDNSQIATCLGDDKEYVVIRNLLPILPKKDMDKVLYDFQMYNWKRKTNYCGVCGSRTEFEKEERCKVCLKCNEKYFPYLFPAVIVSITNNDKILLAHNANFPENLYSVIAGYVDLGESLEDCVKREVFEEVGIEIEDIEYYASQNWGFSSSLMIGFKAKFKSGEIKIDGKEIVKAEWYTRDNMPDLPPKMSIGRLLIEDFINS